MRPILIALAGATLFAANVASAGGASQTRNLAFQSNGAGVCQAALPAFEGLIRKRPMAIQNEGNANAFVTCSPVTLQGIPDDFGHGVFLVNYNATPVTLTCTGVQGARDGVARQLLARSVEIAANNYSSIYWTEDDGFAPGNDRSFNMSCNLQPGTGVTTVYTNQLLDVGA